MNKGEIHKNNKSSFGNLFKIFVKTSKKRLVFTIIISILVFTLLSTFLLTWFNYKYNSFYNFIDERGNWRNDNRISVEYYSISRNYFSVYDDYLSKCVDEMTQFMNDNFGHLVRNFTAALTAEVYNFQFYPAIENQNMRLYSLYDEAYTALSSSIIQGRFPNNKSEILYLPLNSSEPLYALNDTVILKGVNTIVSQSQNFTVVGILNNVYNNLFREGYSSDIFLTSPYDNWDNTYLHQEIFLTNETSFIEIINNFTNYNGDIDLIFDFNYQLEIKDIKNLNGITGKIFSFIYPTSYLETISFDYLPNEFDTFLWDLNEAILFFGDNWLVETVFVFASGIPLLLLFSLICMETFHIGDFEKISKFKIIKIQGLEYKDSRKMILFEKLLVTTIGFFVGLFLGNIIGYFIFMGMGNFNIGIYLSALIEPTVIIALVVLFILLFLGSFLLENNLIKKAAQTTPEIYKRKRRKILKKIFTTQEIITLIPGILLAGIGFTAIYFIPSAIIGLPAFNYEALLLIFIFITAIGMLFILTSIFLLLARLICGLWQILGNIIWKKSKSYLTLSLKHLAVYNKDYTRVILAIFIVGLAITPGLIVHKTVNDYIPVEASLAVGCSDILVNNWNNNFTMLDEITNYPGIEKVTSVTLFELYEDNFDHHFPNAFNVRILSINNITEFLETVDTKIFEKAKYSISDIKALENEMNFLMNEQYAKEEHYDKGKVFYSSNFLDTTNGTYQMNYVNKYDFFPLMEKFYSSIYYSYYKHYGLIVSNLTASKLLPKKSDSTWLTHSSKILIKTTPTANITLIREKIFQDYGLHSQIPSEIEEMLMLQKNDSIMNFFVIISIISSISLIFFGYITAKNIYFQRLRIIESEYQVGAKKKQIWGNFTVEFLFIILIPQILTMILTVITLNFVLQFLLTIESNFKEFKPWLPWWLIIIIIIFCLVTITSGWSIEMIYQTSKYRPIRQE
ncbi:MAG: FtsX-like permease family protein [Candidatus Thorarchaeota archaeon]